MSTAPVFVQVPKAEYDALKEQLKRAQINAAAIANKKVKINKNEDWLMIRVLRFSFWLNDLIHRYNKMKWDKEYERALVIYSSDKK